MSWQYGRQQLYFLTFKSCWNDAVSLCDALCEGIERAAIDGSAPSQSLSECLRRASEQLFYHDAWGKTPHHLAFSRRPPLQVVEALFRVERLIRNYETVFPRVPRWLLPCDNDLTPIFMACAVGTKVSVLQHFLDEVEYYIEQNWVDPCVRMLVLRPDIQGTTPLMGWFSRRRKFIADLEIAYSDASRDLAHDRFLQMATRMVWFVTRHVYAENPSLSNPMMVHRCALIAPYCPVLMMELLVHLFKDVEDAFVSAQECAASRDERGRLPLHNAIESIEIPSALLELRSPGQNFMYWDRRNKKMTETSRHHYLEANRNEMIQTLLNWYPKAAGEPFPNGRSPLCEAIARGGIWHSSISSRIDPDAVGLIQMLYNHAPENLLERDTVTGLFPFMLAATIVPSLDDKQTEAEALDTIYNLLRNDPQPIQFAFRRSSTNA